MSEELVGTRMKVKLLEVDEETERLVFSNRRASSETQMAGHKVRPLNRSCLQPTLDHTSAGGNGSRFTAADAPVNDCMNPDVPS